MCLSIRPLRGAHCFSFLQINPFWEAPTSSSHRNFILGHLLTPSLTCGSSKCARLSAPFQGPTILVKVFCKAPTRSSHRNIISSHLLTPGFRFGGSKCARLSAPSQGPN